MLYPMLYLSHAVIYHQTRYHLLNGSKFLKGIA